MNTGENPRIKACAFIRVNLCAREADLWLRREGR